VFEGMEYLLETLFGRKVMKDESTMRGWGVGYCFGHVAIVAHVS